MAANCVCLKDTVQEIPTQMVFKQIELMIWLLKKYLYYFRKYNIISVIQNLNISRPPFSLTVSGKSSKWR